MRQCTKERTAVPMLHDDKLKVQLKRVIRNTQLTGTYESVAKKHKTSMAQAQPSADQQIHMQQSLQTKYTRTDDASQQIEQQSATDDEEKELQQHIKHLPKTQMQEATQAHFTQKVQELTYPKNPTLFSASNQRNQRQQRSSISGRFNSTQYRTINSSVITSTAGGD